MFWWSFVLSSLSQFAVLYVSFLPGERNGNFFFLLFAQQRMPSKTLANSDYRILKKTSKESTECYKCRIAFLPGELQAGVWGSWGGGSHSTSLQRPRHIACIGPRTARAMCGSNRKVSGVNFFCNDDERKDACEKIKRIAWGVQGE
jgi:hypothetical protein